MRMRCELLLQANSPRICPSVVHPVAFSRLPTSGNARSPVASFRLDAQASHRPLARTTNRDLRLSLGGFHAGRAKLTMDSALLTVQIVTK
jgi:hypothetical protein